MQIYPPLDALGDSAFQKFRFSFKNYRIWRKKS